jgi:hypothetical protein
MRLVMRERVRASSLCAAVTFAQDLLAVLRSAWKSL